MSPSKERAVMAEVSARDVDITQVATPVVFAIAHAHPGFGQSWMIYDSLCVLRMSVSWTCLRAGWVCMRCVLPPPSPGCCIIAFLDDGEVSFLDLSINSMESTAWDTGYGCRLRSSYVDWPSRCISLLMYTCVPSVFLPGHVRPDRQASSQRQL